MAVRDLDDELPGISTSRRACTAWWSRVDPAGAAFEADIQRGHVLMEINRQPVRSVGDFQRLVAAAKSGDVLTLYIFNPGSGRALHTLKID